MNARYSAACRVGLLLTIMIACACNLLWIERNIAPLRSWDDAEYLAQSINTYHALERGDLIGFVRLASRPARGVHPPMASLAPIPMYVLFGPGPNAALYANTLLIPVFGVYLFLIARRLLGSDRAGLIAVVVTFCFPLTYGLWRLVMAEFGLAVATVAAQYHLLRCTGHARGNGRHAILAGLFIGWGLLWKTSLPVFVIGPLAYLLVRGIRAEGGVSPPLFRTLATIAAAAAIVAGPFYLWRLRSLWDFAVYNTTPSSTLEQFSLGAVLSPVTVLKYWTSLANFGTSAYFLLLGAGLAVAALLRRNYPMGRQAAWFVASCLIPPLVFFSFQYLKEPRHLFAAFAMIGITIAALLEATLRGRSFAVRSAVLAALLVFPAYQFVVLSFEPAWAPVRDLRLGPLVLLPGDRDSLFGRPANRTVWPVAEIVDLIATSRQNVEDPAARVRVVGHIPYLDGPTLNYESLVRHHQSLDYSMLGDLSLRANGWDIVMAISGPIRRPYESREPLLARLLEEGRLPFAVLGRVTLPGGRWVDLYRPAPSASAESTADGNLVTAVDRQGAALFPVARAKWDLAEGRRVVAVPRDGSPVDFEYVYVPRTAATLQWQTVRNPSADCVEAKYVVTMFDRNAHRGPMQTLSKAFSALPGQAHDVASLDVARFHGQIVTIRLGLPSPAGQSEPCIGWSDVRLVSDAVVTGR